MWYWNHYAYILEKCDSFHRTESALLKVLNDLLLTTDSGDCALPRLLDLTAAFDTVGHTILIDRLNNEVGSPHIRETEPSLLIQVPHRFSSSPNFSCGIPQGSILGPILFSIYMLLLGQIIHKSNPSLFHKHYHQKPGPASYLFKQSAKNLGVIFNSANIKFEKRVKSIVKTSFLQLRNVSKINNFFHSMILKKSCMLLSPLLLDYCNSLYFGISQSSISQYSIYNLHLQLAARLLTEEGPYHPCAGLSSLASHMF